MDAPATLANQPAPQARQVREVAAEGASLYAPAAQDVHRAEVGAAPTSTYDPALQAVQLLVPVTSPLKKPAAHDVQTADVLAAGSEL